MPDFEELSAEETRQYHLFRRFGQQVRVINLRGLEAESAITLADVISASVSIDQRDQEQALLLMRLSRRKAEAFESLSHYNASIQWVAYKLFKAIPEVDV